MVRCLNIEEKKVILALQNLKDKMGKTINVLDHLVGMEETIPPVEIQDVLNTNEIITLLTQ